jgi:hypothetical protein
VIGGFGLDSSGSESGALKTPIEWIAVFGKYLIQILARRPAILNEVSHSLLGPFRKFLV